VSPFCLGIVNDPRAVGAAFDAGINFFFLTADLHWPLYENLRRGLDDLIARSPSVRDEIVVAVVSYVQQPDFSDGPFSEVLAMMPRLGRADVQIAGGGYAPEIHDRVERYRAQQVSGEFGARAVGATVHQRKAALPLVNNARVEAVFVRYNPLHPGAREDLFPAIEPSPTLLYNFKTTIGVHPPEFWHALGCLEGETWIPTHTDHYRFAFARPQIDGVLCALTTPEQVTALADAIEEGPLAPEEEEHMLALGELEKKARPAETPDPELA
jgi:hypothetical protein